MGEYIIILRCRGSFKRKQRKKRGSESQMYFILRKPARFTCFHINTTEQKHWICYCFLHYDLGDTELGHGKVLTTSLKTPLSKSVPSSDLCPHYSRDGVELETFAFLPAPHFSNPHIHVVSKLYSCLSVVICQCLLSSIRISHTPTLSCHCN